MAMNTANCFKIETAGLLIGWTYFIAFIIGFFTILTASLIGIYIYIAGGDGILIALLIFFIMVISLIITGGMAFLSKDFLRGIKEQKIPQIRRFKYLIAVLVLLAFLSLIIALVGSTQTFTFQKYWDRPSTPPLGLEFVAIALVILSFHIAILVIVDIIHKKFNHFEMRKEIYRENSNLNIVSYQSRPHREVHMRVPEIELPLPPPPPSKF